jgi:hypothetical protein
VKLSAPSATSSWNTGSVTVATCCVSRSVTPLEVAFARTNRAPSKLAAKTSNSANARLTGLAMETSKPPAGGGSLSANLKVMLSPRSSTIVVVLALKPMVGMLQKPRITSNGAESRSRTDNLSNSATTASKWREFPTLGATQHQSLKQA